jgi:hypothetical protein
MQRRPAKPSNSAHPGVNVLPYLGLYGDYEADGDTEALAAAGLDAELAQAVAGGLSGRVTGGIDVTIDGGLQLRIHGDLSGLGANVQTWSLGATIGGRF